MRNRNKFNAAPEQAEETGSSSYYDVANPPLNMGEAGYTMQRDMQMMKDRGIDASKYNPFGPPIHEQIAAYEQEASSQEQEAVRKGLMKRLGDKVTSMFVRRVESSTVSEQSGEVPALNYYTAPSMGTVEYFAQRDEWFKSQNPNYTPFGPPAYEQQLAFQAQQEAQQESKGVVGRMGDRLAGARDRRAEKKAAERAQAEERAFADANRSNPVFANDPRVTKYYGQSAEYPSYQNPYGQG